MNKVANFAFNKTSASAVFKVNIMWSILKVNGLVGTLYLDTDGWDSNSKRFTDMRTLSNNNHDSWTQDIDEELKKHGLEIDTKKKHKIDDLDNGIMTLYLRKKVDINDSIWRIVKLTLCVIYYM